MWSFFLVILLPPVTIALGVFLLLKGITWKEFLVMLAAELLVAGCSAGIVSCESTHDTEVWNGVVAKKERVTVSCSHSYRCHCHEVCTGSGKNKSCSEECDTCYEHTWDYDWNVYTSNNETITIDRVDRQGTSEPSRFASVKVGEPTSVIHGYTNYIKASPDSLFRHQGLKEKYKVELPDYPQNVYDYYRLNRLVTAGVSVVDPGAWNSDLSQVNALLGHNRQANIIVVLAKNKPHDWYSALEESWIGGKKNDVVLVISVDDTMKPQWVEVMAWTTNPIFKVKLRDDVMDEQVIDRSTVITALKVQVNTTFIRKPMADFEYLSSCITPSKTEWIITLIIGILIAAGLAWLFEVNDIFGDEDIRYYSGHRRNNRYY